MGFEQASSQIATACVEPGEGGPYLFGTCRSNASTDARRSAGCRSTLRSAASSHSVSYRAARGRAGDGRGAWEVEEVGSGGGAGAAASSAALSLASTGTQEYDCLGAGTAAA